MVVISDRERELLTISSPVAVSLVPLPESSEERTLHGRQNIVKQDCVCVCVCVCVKVNQFTSNVLLKMYNIINIVCIMSFIILFLACLGHDDIIQSHTQSKSKVSRCHKGHT